MTALRGFTLLALAAALLIGGAGPLGAQQEGQPQAQPEVLPENRSVERPGRTGLPLPRFVSLASGEINLRAGPGRQYPIEVVYRRQSMPVEVIDEFENWRRIRDWEGAEGWVYHSLLSGRRTALVTTKAKDELVPLYENPDAESAVVARLQTGVLGTVKHCESGFCRFVGDKFDGYVVQARLFGVYPNEKLK
jgi:SH3-like domain-containing protein